MPFEARMRDRNRFIHTRQDTLETSGTNAAHAVKFARLAAAYAIELGKGELAAPPAQLAAATPAPAPVPAHRGCDGARGLGALASLGLLAAGLALARWIAARTA
jgi:hypothetical protein